MFDSVLLRGLEKIRFFYEFPPFFIPITTVYVIVSLRTIQKSLICRQFWIVRKLTMTKFCNVQIFV
jgi:hypothetical protein